MMFWEEFVFQNLLAATKFRVEGKTVNIFCLSEFDGTHLIRSTLGSSSLVMKATIFAFVIDYLETTIITLMIFYHDLILQLKGSKLDIVVVYIG